MSREIIPFYAADMSALATRLPDAVAPPRRKPLRVVRPVKPRTHFGLRGMPR